MDLKQRRKQEEGLLVDLGSQLVLQHPQGCGAALGVAAVSCWLATDLCPWAWLQRSPIGPVVQTLQFPWRWLGVASLALTVITLCGLAELLEDHGLPAALSAALLPVGLTLVTVVAFYQPLTPIDTELQPMIDGSQTKYWTDDLYLPEGAEPEMRWFVHDDPSGLTVRSLARADGVVTIDCAADGQDGSLELPLLYYPGYTVPDGQGIVFRTANGMVGVTVPAGYSGEIRVEFREPRRWLAADLVSLATALALAARLGPRLEEGKLQKAAIVLFLLGGVSIIVKSVVFHT